MLWFIVILFAYFFLGIASLGDKVFLKGKQQTPAIYTFYVGVLSGLVILLIPFFGLEIPSLDILVWPLLEGVLYVAALFSLYFALSRFEVSVVVPTIGGLQPIFVFILTILVYGFTDFLLKDAIALIILVIGTFLISLEKDGSEINKRNLSISIIPALLFALDIILTKQVFLHQDFWQGLICMRFFTFIVVLFFLLSPVFRKELFSKKLKNKKGEPKKGIVFLAAQGAGGLGIFLQSYAISLVPVMYLAVINALKGIQYIFLLIITLIISYYFPKIIKEDFKKKILIRKIVSVIIIAAGIALLML